MKKRAAVTAIKSNAKEAVLGQLRSREQRPSDLLEHLANQGYPSVEVKRVLTKLLDESQIELTPQRRLRTR
jgi:hypothetical protein